MRAAVKRDRDTVQPHGLAEVEVGTAIERLEIDHLDIVRVVLARKFGGIHQRDTRHRRRGFGAIHRPAKPGPMQLRQPPAMVAMRMGQKDTAQRPRIETQPRRPVGSHQLALGMGTTVHKRTQPQARIRKQAGRARDAVRAADEG